MTSQAASGTANPATPPSAATSPVLRLRLIGQMEAWTLNSESVLPAGRKTRALLATIALSGNRPALRGRLAELLWSRRSEEQARASLRQEIYRLLDALSPAGEDILIVTRDHLMLRPGAAWVDVDEVMRASVAEPASLSLLDGDLLEDLNGVDPSFDSWLAAERERVRDHGRDLAEALLRESENSEEAIPAAQKLLSIDRTHEGAWRTLMRAHASRGERGMAIQAYERCRAVLAELLDAAPSTETQQLLAQIRGPSGRASPRRPQPPRAEPETEPEREEDVPEPAPEITPPAAILSASPNEPREQRPSRGGARVGIMPFQMVGTSDDDAHLAPGLAEEMTTAMSRFRWMMVVLVGSLDSLPPDRRDENAIRRAFGLDFLLDGSVQRVGERLRITVRLVDLRDGNQVVWARRFDRQARDLFSLQDEIAAEVVAQVDPEILLIESKRVAARPLQDATAYDLMLRALPLIWRMERSPYMQAGDFLAQAIELDPEFASAHAWYAVWHIFFVGQGWADDPRQALDRAGQLAERAILLDPQDAKALTIAGHVRAFLYKQPHEGLALHDKALTVNPNLAMAWALSGVAHAYLGNLDEAERRITRYKRLSPLDPHAFFYDTAFIIVALLKRDYETAVVTGRTLSQMNASFSNMLKVYLSALGHLRYLREAAGVLEKLLVVEPDFSVRQFRQVAPYARQEDLDHIAVGLELAGVPEGD